MTKVTFYPGDDRIGFLRTGAGGKFSAEASTLFGPTHIPDEFDLTVSATGNVKRFKGKSFNRDREGDILFWTYEAPGGFTFTLFND